MKRYYIFSFGLLLLLGSCTKKLDQTPNNAITADEAYSTPLGYKQGLAKMYSGFALTGNTGGTGSPDIPSQIIPDEGNSDFLRLYFNLQELTTDEAAWTWEGDAGIQGLHEMSWSSINPIVDGLYYRSFFQITLCNEFIRQASDANLAARGITGAHADSIRNYRAEARFIRAYQYWVLMDLYGSPPFVTEKDAIGTFIPKQISRKDLFVYIESELKAIDGDLVPARHNEYGRADQAAAWSLLARMYLNAEVYTGTAHYTDAITYCTKIIGAGYQLHGNYRELMLADNNLNTEEFIFTINYDALYTQNYGGTTYLLHGPANVPAYLTNSSGSWTGLRCTQNFIALFGGDYSGNTDHRAQFWDSTQTLQMKDLYTAADGLSTFKYRNVNRDTTAPAHQDTKKDFSDIDFPLFRLGEIYLIYAESVLRGGTGGDAGTALHYINLLRERAYGGAAGDITGGTLTTDFILDERGRELYYEAFRRTDLIRYKKFTTAAYLWAWKGGVEAGTSVGDKYNLFPIPTTDLSANPNLTQNTGY